MNWNRRQKVLRIASTLLAACTLGAATPAAVTPVFHSSYQAASAAAAADQSLVLLVFSAEWCGPCKQLKSKTFASTGFLHQENPLHVADVDIDANSKMAGDFGIEAVPTLILLTSDGKIISRQTGFMEPIEMTLWLEAGRDRAAAGQWQGTAPGSQFNEFIRQAAADNLGPNEIQKLVALLGDTDPANRDQAGKILLSQRENAVPPLIEAVGHPYLGVRISASELLRRLAPGVQPIDPWQSPVEMSNAVVALRKWWNDTGKLAPVSVASAVNVFSANFVKEALEQLRGDDPVRRTTAMTTLVRLGPDALPAVREAIKRAEKTGDQRALGLLEDVRWTILVPDPVEQQNGGLRRVLARGKSMERRAATERLGHSGREALGSLTELASDPDPLVVEGAIRALASLGGGTAIPALASLLNSPDSNLRMTAAQALGHTKNSAAVQPLLTATGDTDEVVACAALSALEETQTRESYSSTPRELPPEITAGLKRCLADPRWRVRASAAEVAGKLSARKLVDDLKNLLADNDGFVVKRALTALGDLHAMPEPEQLSKVSERLPSLQSDTVAMMLEAESDDAIKTITKQFNAGTTETRLAILNAFLRRGISENEQMDAGWKPMLAQAIASSDPRLRRGAAEILNRRSPKLAAPLVGPLLADEDRETSLAAASVVLRILDQDRGGSLSSTTFYSSATTKTNKPVASATKIAEWHAAMSKHMGSDPEWSLAAAVYATGDAKADLPLLLAALDDTNNLGSAGRLNRQADLMAIELIVPMLPWPEGRAGLDKLSATPVRYAMAASQSGRSQSEVAKYLLEPTRFKAVLEPAGGTALSECLELLAGYDYEYRENHTWSLWMETDRTKAITLALVESTNAAWRAAAVFSLGLRADAKDNLKIFEAALVDANPWVRGSAVRTLARNLKERPALEQQVAPLLADTNLPVAKAAALALLEPEIRTAAGLETELNYFEFEAERGGRSQSYNSQNDDRPLAVLEGKPAFLPAARERLVASTGSEAVPFALLLAQFGEFDGISRLATELSAPDAGNDDSLANALLAGIALSRDAKYLPALRQLAAARTNESELRKVLQALKGISGPDARQMRLDINKKIRSAGGSSSSAD